MTPEEILTPQIQEVLSHYNQYGRPIKLKSKQKMLFKSVLIRTIIILIIALISISAGGAIAGFIVFAVGAFWIAHCIKKTDNIKIINKLAAQNPDTPIQEIIAKEVVYK